MRKSKTTRTAPRPVLQSRREGVAADDVKRATFSRQGYDDIMEALVAQIAQWQP
jgi:hypothetical protein